MQPLKPLMQKAIFSGTFDPLTLGHLDIIRRVAPMFERLNVCIAINPKKHAMFTLEQRLAFIREATADIPNIDVDACHGLLVDYCRHIGATIIVRGLRTSADFEYEYPMALANRALAPEIETIFISAAPEKIFLSSSAVKEIASYGRDISAFVPKCVAKAMKSAVSPQDIN